MTLSEKELVRLNRALTQQRDILLRAISEHLGDGKPIDLQEAILVLKGAAIIHNGTIKHVGELEAKVRELNPPKEPVNRLVAGRKGEA